MLINRRKILASIGLLMANSVWSLLCFGQSTYTLVTSESDLVAGNKYIIVGKKNDAYKAMGYDKGNNRTAIDVNVSNDSITVECAKLSSGTDSVFEFRLNGSTDNWTFYDSVNNTYLFAASSSKNYLQSIANITNNLNAQWSIKIGVNGVDTITANGSNTNKKLKYNSSSSLFACYSTTSTTGTYVYLYKKSSTQSNTPPIDIIPPVFSSSYPKVENVTISSFDLKVKANEPCTVYYRVVAEGEPAPTVNDLLASDSTITVATGNTECSATVTGLESETTYNVYLIAKDTADNVQEDSTIISVTTVSAIQKSIALRDIEAIYYWGEMATIKWTATNFDASTDLDSILIFKGNDKILSYPIDITSGEADILIGNGITPNKDTYAINYSLKVVSGNEESERSENFTIVPVVTINQLLTDTTTRGALNFNNKIVKVIGVVTSSKFSNNKTYKNFTLQDGDSAFCSIYVNYCYDTIVATGDSVFAEGRFNINTNEQYRIGSSTTYTSTATRINSNNNLPAPRATEISVTQTKALMSSLIKIIGVNCDNAKSCFYIGEDTIYYKETLYTGVLNPLDNRKYDISGVLGRGTDKRYEIWPRSEADIHLYSNDTTLANLVIGGHNALNSDTLIINNLTITGIAATANNAMASLSIRVNNNFVSPADWANVTLAPLDSVFVTVTAEDGTAKTYKRIIDCKTLFFSPLATNSFGTGDTISLAWTSYNISQINLTLDIQNDTIQLTDSAISADLGEWDFVVPDAMFGSGLVKAVRNGVVLDSIAVTISDTKAPVVVRQSPANGSDSLANSLYISMAFDEKVVVTDGAKLNVGNTEALIVAVNDTMVKAFVGGLDFGTEYSVELPAGALKDLAGNSAILPTWTFTTRTAPQPDLYFSEYAKGSSNNKYYEIYNPCDTAVDLTRYFVTMDAFSSNGSRSQTTLQLSGWLMPDEVLIVANSSAAAEIKQKTDVSTTKTTTFTGDDLLGLFRKDGNDTVLIDVLGPFGECDVAANWVVAGDNNASSGKTIVRKLIICGTADWNESAGTDSLDSQWIVLELQNDLSSLGCHGIGHGTEIMRMSIGGKAATVNSADTTVSVEVPYGTDLTKLAVSYRISQGAQMFINDSLAADTIDFSSPVLATIVAGDGINQKNWTITVTMAPRPSSDANILTFNFVETTPISVSIDTTNATIDAVVAYNLDSLNLTPVITISEKAKVPTTLFRSSRGIFTAKTRWDFDEPQTITVTAEDLTVKNWTVSVAKEPEPHLTFSPLASNAFGTGDTIRLSWTSYNILQISLTLDIQDNTIQLTDSAISADLGEWNFVVPDAMFGNGLVKAVRNGVALDSVTVTISDTKAPVVVRQSPANGRDSLANSMYISMAFDEKVVVTDGAKLNVGNTEALIVAVNDTMVKAFVSCLDFGTEFSVELPADAVKDLTGNSATLPTWTLTTRTAPQPDLYFSEYAKGSSNNKYYEIYNPCDTAVDLTRYFVTMDKIVGNQRLTTLQLSGTLPPNEVLVVANGSASAEIKKRTDVSNSGTTKFTGDDLLGLFRKDGSDTVLIDVLGPFGNFDVASNWGAAGIADASTNRTIVRKIITCGTADWNESAGTDSLDSQWIVLELQNDLSSLGRHGIGHGTEIMRMSIGGKAATVNNADTTVSVEVPYGTDIEHLFTTFRISQGAQMFIGEALATDTIDFSSPVLATIAAGDGINQKNWTITVTMAPRPSSDANILTFNFVETTPISVSIDTTNARIDAVVAYNIDSLKLTPVITISEKAKVPTTLFKSSRGIFTAKTRWDFDEPQNIAVTAEDTTTKVWHINVEKEPEPHLTFFPLASNAFGTGDTISLSWTSYNISQISLTLDIQNNTIQLTDSAISADLGEWNFVVPDAMFGNGLVKAVRNGITLDSLAVTISDTKAPMVVRQSPANGSDSLANSMYISMTFDEKVVVTDGAKLNVGNTEALIVAVNDTMVKAFVSGLDFGTEYSVELPADAVKDLTGNSATLPTWTLTTRTAPQPDLYFSEYAKGSSNNKYYEIYNPCDTAVDLTRYFVTMDEFTSSSRKRTSLQLSGWLLPNEVLVVANGSASVEIKKRTDVSNSGTTKFTGDDLLGLFRKDGSDTVLIDVLGPFGECETAVNWAVAGIADASANRTIVRNVIICGTTDWNESAGTDSLDSQWTVLPQNDLSSLGRHSIGHGTEILRMSIGGKATTINSADTTVSVEVPYGTDLTQLAVSCRISQSAQMFVNGSLAADTVDFSQPVTATIIAGDNINQKNWTIIVTMAPRPSSDANILTFNFVETTPISVSIDTTNATIDAVVAYNLDSLKLTPVITISEKAKVSTTLFRSSRGIFTAKTRWDFDEPQNIAVTAEDLTVKNWTVRVAKEPEPHLTFSPLTSNAFGTGDTISLSWTSYNISNISLSLDIQNNTIQLTDSAISVDLSEWNFVVPDAMFGSGLVKAVRNGVVLDSIAVTISDTKAPIVVRQSPANGSDSLANSLYISINFDERITVAEGAKLNIGELEFPITAVSDSAAKAFVSGLDYNTLHNISLSEGAICDLAGNSATLPTWTFSTRTAPQPDLYFSEYAKGSSNNKYYEIYNPCDTAVDLNRYFVTMDAFSSNGSRSQATLQLSGWLMPNEMLVVANSSAATAIKQNADVSTTKTTTFTGDDLLGLFRKDGADTVLIDVLGPFGECDAANYWSAAGVEKVSTDHTIVRNVIICGTTYWNESAGTDSLDSQWTVLGKDDWSDLGRHGIGHNADILKMSIGGIEANIYPAAMGVLVEVPYGTDLTRLAVSYRISQGAQMFINDSLAADTVDLSQPVTATVIAGDSVNQKVWTIIVTMAPKPSSDNNILTFSFVETAPISVTIDTANATIDAFMAYNLDSLKLTPVITIAEMASVSSTLFKSSKRVFTAKTKWDFNEPQTIRVTAEDLTEKVWSVRVDWEKSKELTIKDIAKLDGGLMANVGKPISTEGIVTHIVITSKGAEIHIQDSTGMWSGIMVFDEGNLYAANVAVGDRIKVSGVIAENFGMACIEQIEALAITSSDNRILTDTIIVEDALSTAYQNAIVTIDSVVCTGGFENLFAVSDSTNSILIYNKYRISDFALEIDSMYRITGIVYYTSADNSYRIIPRSADDIVKLVRPLKPEQTKPEEQKPEEQKPQEPDTTTVGISGTHIGLTAYTIGRTIVVENADATVTVFDIAGRLIATARPARRIAISAPHSGIYIVGTRQGAIKVRVD